MVIEAIDVYQELGDDPFANERLQLLFVRFGDMEEARRYEGLARQRSVR